MRKSLVFLLIALTILSVQAQKADKGWEAIIDGWFCTPDEYTTYSARETASYGLVLTADNKFSKCVSNDQAGRIPGCQIYDENGKCLECDCDKGLSHDSAACIDNFMFEPHCAQYDKDKKCIRCKYTYNEQIIDSKNSDNKKNVEAKHRLDFGLYKGKCYSNVGNIPNCHEYDEGGATVEAANCKKCHYNTRWFATENGKQYYDDKAAEQTPSFFKYRHFLLKIPDEPTPRTKCQAIPETFESYKTWDELSETLDFFTKQITTEGIANQWYFACKKDYYAIVSTTTPLNGFSLEKKWDKTTGCQEAKDSKLYALNGCYRILSKDSQKFTFDDCDTTKVSGAEKNNAYSKGNLERIDYKTVQCTACKGAGKKIDDKRSKCMDGSVTDCEVYTIKGSELKCSQCIGTKFLTSDNTCVDKIANCKEQLLTDGTKCKTCERFYTLSEDQKSCKFQEEVINSETFKKNLGQFGCAALSDEAKKLCKECDSSLGFSLDGSFCDCKVSKFEKNYLMPTVCMKESDKSSGKCTKLFMQDTINRYECTDCVKSYDWQYCYGSQTVDNNCVEKNKDWCMLCKSSDYAITGQGKCMDTGIKNCEHMEYFITQRSDDYLVNCWKYKTAGGKKECTKCMDGYGLDTEKKNLCKQNSALMTEGRCATIDPDDYKKCKLCQTAYYLKADKSGCSARANTVENCAVYEDPAADTKKCTKCEKDYGLSAGKDACAKAPNCKITDPASSIKCLVCSTGFVLNSDHVCYDYITLDNCIVYAPDKFTCAKCQKGYGLSKVGEMVVCKKIDNCLQPSQDKFDTCTECNHVTHYLVDGKCVAGDIATCVLYKDTEKKCMKCGTLKYAKDGACVDNDLTECKVQKMDGDTNVCEQCNERFYWSGSACTTVDKKYVDFCLEYAADSKPSALKCTKCVEGYTKKGDTSCIKNADVTGDDKITDCEIYSQTDITTCEKCTGKYVVGKVCSGVYSGDVATATCAELDPKADKCTKCKDEHLNYLFGGKCKTPAAQANCQKLFQNPSVDAAKCQICKIITGEIYVFNGENCAAPGGDSDLINRCVFRNEDGSCQGWQPGWRKNGAEFVKGDSVIEWCIQQAKPDTTEICNLCYDSDIRYPDAGTCKNRAGEQFTSQCLGKVPTKQECSKPCKSPNGFKDADKSCQAPADAGLNCAFLDPNSNTICFRCSNDYQFIGTTCTLGTDNKFKTIDNCEIYTQKACEQCKTGFIYDKTNEKCVVETTQANCESYDRKDSQNCIKCKPNFYFNAGACTDIPAGDKKDNCKYYANDKKCSECDTNWVLDKVNNKCLKPTDCDKALPSDGADCEKCGTGKYPKAGEDQKISCVGTGVMYVPYCYKYSAYGKCETCLGNLSPDKAAGDYQYKSCINKVTSDYCISIDKTDPEKCDVCAEHTYKSVDGKKCERVTTKIEGCLVYKDATKCQSCSDQYYLDADTCKQLAKCLQHQSSTICDVCEPPYIFDADSSQCKKANDLKTQVYEVDDYQMFKYCTLCQAGFTLNKKLFAPDGSTEQCIKDQPKFMRGDSHCAQYSTSKTCSSCDKGYTLIKDIYSQNYCVEQEPATKSVCEAYEPYHDFRYADPICLICKNELTDDTKEPKYGYNLVTKKCERIDTNWEYKVYLENKVWNRIIIQCKTDQTYDLPTKACKITTANKNCLTQSDGDVCAECRKDKDYGYVKVGTTYKCILNSGDPLLPKSFCAKYNPVAKDEDLKTATCTECHFGYYLEGTDCKPKIANCLAFGWQQDSINPNKMYCIKCEPKYRLNYQSGLCEEYKKDVPASMPITLLPCILYNAQYECLQCAGPYLLQESGCYLKLKSCLIQDKNTCKKCLNGYVLQNGECVATSQPGCDKYDAATGKCTSCKSYCPNKLEVDADTDYVHKLVGFTDYKVWNWQYYGLYDGKCYEGCSKFDATGKCTECANYLTVDCEIKISEDVTSGYMYNLQLYYMQGSECVKRDKFVKYCQEYSTKSNDCVRCRKGYKATFTDSTNTFVKECTACPAQTAPTCKFKSNTCTCESCDKPMEAYLNTDDNKCITRTNSKDCGTVADKFDLNKDVCKGCKPTYKLDDKGLCKFNDTCYMWPVTSPGSQTECESCNSATQGEYKVGSAIKKCINNDGIVCSQYKNNEQSTDPEYVCSDCPNTEADHYILIQLQKGTSDSYRIECKKMDGCTKITDEDKYKCETPEKSTSDKCPKITTDSFNKWNCEKCYYKDRLKQYGMRYQKTDKYHFCVNNLQGGLTPTAVEGCQTYGKDNVNCQYCWDEYQRVSAKKASEGFEFDEEVTKCEYVKTFCRNIGCILLTKDQDREWPQCHICRDDFDVNEKNRWCDEVSNPGKIAPGTDDDGTGKDGGLTSLPLPPKPTYGKYLVAGIEVVVMLALGIFAFLL